MKRIIVLISLAITVVAYGADVTVPSSWNEEKQAWIGDVDALTNALRNASNNQTVYLSRGVYDLSPLTNAPMYKADGTGYVSCSFQNRTGVVFKTGLPQQVQTL